VGGPHLRLVRKAILLVCATANCWIRFVNLGNPTLHLATEELKPHDILPIGDKSWDDDKCTSKVA
jgi:hypothetical protein